jgi:hypothetical protein
MVNKDRGMQENFKSQILPIRCVHAGRKEFISAKSQTNPKYPNSKAATSAIRETNNWGMYAVTSQFFN